MLHIVTYDIPQEFNPIRTRIAHVLKNWGLERVQYSVFMGHLTHNEAETVAMQIQDILHSLPADLRIIPVCKNCQNQILVVSENPYSEAAEEEFGGVTLI